MNPEDVSRGIERCPIPLENPADVTDVLDFVVSLYRRGNADEYNFLSFALAWRDVFENLVFYLRPS